jgi:alginate O-acetyltransferase complex protein AlgI
MLFNSFPFAIFFPIVFILYWFVFNKSLKSQNILILVASYYFYSCWDWRFVFLLSFSTFLDFYTGIKIYESKNNQWRKTWLVISVATNLGFLAVFKYYNFFIGSFADFIEVFGLRANFTTLNVILPVGISFYTFHGLSYVFDIYNRKIKPSTNVVNYSLFVSFFPLLVAGPIERATHLLPQVEQPRTFKYTQAVDGLRQILWGLFKKVVVADNCAVLADNVFNNYESHSGSTLILGAIYFAVQIYGDFSGYSDIALGTARLMGFELLRNFAFPYFSRDIAEFWRRWHISLSSWFRDYLYIPLGGSRGSLGMKIRNTFIIFVVSGFWHGANWTFIVWGALHALFFLPLLITNNNRKNMEIAAQNSTLPNIRELLQIATTFALVVFAWIFFRADSVSQAISYISRIFSKSLFSFPKEFSKITVLLILILFVIEWAGRRNRYAIEAFGLNWNKFIRYGFYYGLTILILWFSGNEQPFIYFQF